MYTKRITRDGRFNLEFTTYVLEFLEFAYPNATNIKPIIEEGVEVLQIRCPCKKCKNVIYNSREIVYQHLCTSGFMKDYSLWYAHGELYSTQGIGRSSNPIPSKHVAQEVDDGVGEFPRYEEMVIESMHQPDAPYYQQGTQHPNKSTQTFFHLMNQASEPLWDECQKASTLSATTGLLNWKSEFNISAAAFDKLLPLSKDSLLAGAKLPDNFYETKKIYTKSGGNVPKLVMAYMPIGPRLQRLFYSKKTAQHLTWHSDHPIDPDKMIHPNGFSPNTSNVSPYSCWPVFITVYNLPPWLAFKHQYIMLPLIIRGNKSPGQNLDVFLQPLVDELKMLFSNGIETYDAHRRDNFQMRVVLLWTISDLPAYAMLSGWSTHGYLACPYCSDKSGSSRLEKGRKTCWFDCHRKYMRKGHPFKNDKVNLKKKQTVKEEIPVPYPTGDEIWEIVQNFSTVYDGTPYGPNYVKPQGFGVSHNWVKKSIFWELPYWRHLLIRHNLDVMHIEKNVFENLFHTIMGTPKTKDRLHAREDMKIICDRPLLEPTKDGNGKSKIKKGDYTLGREEVKQICAWLKNLKFPDGYASNIANCVNVKDGSFYAFKSHDCHVFMQRLLPLAIRGFVPKMIYEAVTEMSMFFRVLCSRTLHIQDLSEMKRSIVQTVCKLEKIFPPGFFDSMEHLVIHLVDEALLGGPVSHRWMYQYESSLSGESPLSVFAFPSRRLYEKGGKKRLMSREEHHKAHTYILLNCPEVAPYIREFEEVALGMHPGEPVLGLKDKYFALWFDRKVRLNLDGSLTHLKVLARKPELYAQCHNGYFGNGYKFHTRQYGNGRVTHNFGVCVRGEIDNADESDCYGLVEEILEIKYYGIGRSTVVLFKCTWFDNEGGVVVNKNKLVDVKHKSRHKSNDPFCLASQAEQVFYTPYPKVTKDTKDIWAVVKTKPRGVFEVTEDKNEADGFFQIDERFAVPHDVTRIDRVCLASNTNTYEEISDVDSEGFEDEQLEEDLEDEDDGDELVYSDHDSDYDEDMFNRGHASSDRRGGTSAGNLHRRVSSPESSGARCSHNSTTTPRRHGTAATPRRHGTAATPRHVTRPMGTGAARSNSWGDFDPVTSLVDSLPDHRVLRHFTPHDFQMIGGHDREHSIQTPHHSNAGGTTSGFDVKDSQDSHLPLITIDGMGFADHTIHGYIGALAFESLDHAWPTFTHIPKEVIDEWFARFGTRYRWIPEEAEGIRTNFENILAERFRDRMSGSKRKSKEMAIQAGHDIREINESFPILRNFAPRPIHSSVWNRLIDYWDTPGWKKISLAAKRNRNSGEDDGVTPARHTGGSIGKKKMGKEPLWQDVFYQTRLTPKSKEKYFKGDLEGLRYITPTAEHAHKALEEKYGDDPTQQSDDPELWETTQLQMQGGKGKGRIYGIGSSDLHFAVTGTYSFVSTSSSAKGSQAEDKESEMDARMQIRQYEIDVCQSRVEQQLQELSAFVNLLKQSGINLPNGL
ncbi:hypothetical protein LXL04_008421 [Taraxacum kok-saghyz]